MHTFWRLWSAVLPRLALMLLLAASGLIFPAGRAQSAPPIPAPPQKRPIALVDAMVHPISGPSIPNGVIVFEKGKITAVGRQGEEGIVIPPSAVTTSLRGQHIYPGFLDGYTQLGLTEIDAVRATRDRAETGSINPNVRAEVAFNPESELIPVARSNGVLTALSAPTGGLISGQSAVMRLDGWTWENMRLKAPAALHIRWPRMTPRLRFGQKPEDITKQKKSRDKQLAELRDLFDDARAYQQGREAGTQPVDVRLQALLPVLQKKVPLIVTADRVDQINAAIGFAAQQKVRLIIHGGYDAADCARLLKAQKVPVMIGRVHRLPLSPSDFPDHPFTLANRLRQAGVDYCITSSSAAWDVRNLPYHAATAAAYGLPKEESLKAITLYPAQILGLADRLGSLKVGKQATVIVTTGDPLDVRTQVTAAYIDGRKLDLTDRHKQLYQKYQRRYQQQADLSE